MIDDLRPLFSQSGYSRSRNKWGALTYSLANGDLLGLSQLFKNREIWSVDTFYSSQSNKHEDDDDEPFDYLPTGAINCDYPCVIDSIRKLATNLGYGERYQIEIGLSGAAGARLLISSRFRDPYVGPIYEQEVALRKSIAHDYPTESIMSDFWKLLFSEAGRAVPDELVRRPRK